MSILKNLLIIVVLISASIVAMAQGFKINGNATGIKDSTWLFLRIAKPEKLIDSAMVIKGKFSLSGRATEKATSLILYTAKYTNYVVFWAENKNMNIALKAGEFKKATITGSATEDEDAALSKMLKPISAREDSLTQVYTSTKDTVVRNYLRDQIKKTRTAEKDLYITYIKEHPQSLIATNILDIYASGWGKETTEMLYDNLSPEMKNTCFGQNIRDYIALNKNVKVGDKYTDFAQMNAAGKKIKLSDIKGKYILLDFWASWCGPCREDNPGLVKTYNAFKDKGFAILGVSLDDNKNSWLKAIKDDKLPWENISDLRGDKNKAALIYGISAIPNNFLIDRNGIIIAKNLRGEALDKKLQELLLQP